MDGSTIGLSSGQIALIAEGRSATLDKVFVAFPNLGGGSGTLLPTICAEMGIRTVGELIDRHEEVAPKLEWRDKFNASWSTRWMMSIIAIFDPRFVSIS